MTVPFACVFIAFVVMYLTKAPLALAQHRLPGGYDNRHPREQQATVQGWGRRALAAHQNSFETFAPFAAGVIIAHLAGAAELPSAVCAIVFVVSRVAYVALYLADLHVLRTSVWTVGFLATAGLYLLPWL